MPAPPARPATSFGRSATLAACALGLVLGACRPTDQPASTASTASTAASAPAEAPAASAISVRPLGASPALRGAALTLESPAAQYVEPGTVTFTWSVANFELGVPSRDAATKTIADSAQGQHIHTIVDNNPASEHYEPQFDVELPPGSRVVLAFLARSYHEGVKEPGAFVLREFVVGDGNPSFDPRAPHLFYSRPLGTYAGEDGKRLLLDFYLVNTTLAAGGTTVRATINGQPFTLDQWQPYVIEGLPLGEATIQLELIDARGLPVPGPFNTATRVVTLEAGPGPAPHGGR